MDWNGRAMVAVLAGLGALASGCVVVSADQEGGGWMGKGEQASRKYAKTVSLDGAERLAVKVGAGNLEVYGGSRPDLEIDAVFRAFAKKKERAEEILEEVELREKRRGGTFTVEGHGPKNLSSARYAIDLVLRVPEGIALEISDGSGGIRVENVNGGLEITDGSGGIVLESVGGDTRIDDGSGEIRIRDLDATRDGSGGEKIRISDGSGSIVMKTIRGDLTISDGSGGIEIEDLQGSLDISDGSGGITVDEVSGSVDISDGSGSMRIVNVGGDVGISDGSGSIDVDQVAGNVRIRSDGSGGLHISRVEGSIQKP